MRNSHARNQYPLGYVNNLAKSECECWSYILTFYFILHKIILLSWDGEGYTHPHNFCWLCVHIWHCSYVQEWKDWSRINQKFGFLHTYGGISVQSALVFVYSFFLSWPSLTDIFLCNATIPLNHHGTWQEYSSRISYLHINVPLWLSLYWDQYWIFATSMLPLTIL